MKAATPSDQVQPGATQQPTRVRSAATGGQHPSPHPSNPVDASGGATAHSPSADALHRHPDHNTSGSPSVAAALSSQQRSMQSYSGTILQHTHAQTHSGTTLRLACTQEDQARTADDLLGCTDAVGTMDGVGGPLHGARGPMRGAGGPMHDAERAMHDDLWTQEESVVEYPAAYRQQVRLHCDSTLCLG